MTDRIPLIVNAGAAQIQELPAGDSISITGNIIGGNLNTSGVVSATGNVRGANLNTVGIVSATGNITGNYFIGNGSQLTGISGGTANTGNIGFVSDAIYDINGIILENANLSVGATAALVLPSNGNTTAPVQLNNIYGNITLGTGPSGTITSTWKFDTSGNLVLPSNTSYINYANGQPYGGGGSGNTGNVGFDNYNIYNTQGGGIVISNFNYLTAEAETAYVNIPAGDSIGDLQIVQEKGNVVLNANSTATWSFNADSSFKLPNNSNITIVDNVITQINAVATANSAINIRAFDDGGNTTASTFFDGTDGTLNFYSYNPTTDTSYNWRFDNGGSFTLPNAPGNIYFGEGSTEPVIIPNSFSVTIDGDRSNPGVNYLAVGQDGIGLFSVNPINIDNSSTGLLNTDINIRSGDDIFLRGRNKPDDSESEGGDINVYAGQGANSTATGNDTSGGGDIQIYAGAGGTAQGASTSSGSGGYVEIIAGDGGTSLDSSVGSGGSLTLAAGSAQTATDPANGGWGGGVSISAGTTTRVNESGGPIELTTGGSTGLGYGAAGYLSITIPSSNVSAGGTWTFSGTGKEFNVPADSSIYGANFGNFTVGCAGNTIVTSSDYGANVKNWVFGYTGNLLAPGNIITPTNFVGTSLKTNLADFNWSAFITNMTLGASTILVLDSNVFGDPWSGQITVQDCTGAVEANANWWYQAVDSNAIQLFTDNTFTTPVDSSEWGAYTGGGFAFTIDYGNVEINAQNITIRSDHGDYNNKIWQFNRSGQTVLPVLTTVRGDVSGGSITGYTLNIGDGAQEAIITTPDATSYNAQRLVINPGAGQSGTGGEGGDIYLWAGRGGDTNGNGGDVKIRGGYGPGDGQGGYIRVEAGDVQGAGTPGYIYQRGGDVNVGTGGYIQSQGGQGSTGGYISLTGGYGTDGPGGAVTIAGGQAAGGLTYYGNVNINAGASSWSFDNAGALTLPQYFVGPGPSEQLKIQGTRDIVGTVGNSSAQLSDSTPTLVYVCTSNLVQSAKLTFVVQSNNATFGWEQFDVAVIMLYAGGVGVTVSNRMNNNPANGDTQVTADVNGDGIIEIYLAQPGLGTAYVNYTATEFGLMAD